MTRSRESRRRRYGSHTAKLPRRSRLHFDKPRVKNAEWQPDRCVATTKIAYPTATEAEAHAVTLRRADPGRRVSIYRCRDHYHVGHR